MTFFKWNIFWIVLCSTFFTKCTNGKEEQLDDKERFIIAQFDKVLLQERKNEGVVEEKLRQAYKRGFKNQFIIERYNLVNREIETALKSYALTTDSIDILHRKTLHKLKLAIEDINNHDRKYLIPADLVQMTRFLDSCSAAAIEFDFSFKKRMRTFELILFKKMVNEIFIYSTGTINGCGMGWDPFFSTLIINNYKQEKKSVLEIKFPFGVNSSFFKSLTNGKDTLSARLLNIKYINRNNEIDSSHYKIDLSGLAPGKYSIELCVKLIPPVYDRPDGTRLAQEYCKDIEFEVFK